MEEREEREGRGRRGGEGKGEVVGREMRRRIIVGGMILGLLMGCNNGGENAGGGNLGKAMMEVGKSTEKAFYSFLELISDTLGSVRVTEKTKKSAVGGYFSQLGGKVGEASAELEKVAEKAAAEVDKDELLGKTIREAVDAAKATLSALKGHLESLKDIGDDQVVGEAASNATGVTTSTNELKDAFKAFKGIVDTAEGAGVTRPKAGDTAVKLTNADNKEGAKVLATTNKPGANEVGKASLILASVSGDEMLASIVASQESDEKLSGNAKESTTAMSFALGGTDAHLSTADTPKAAAVAGGIALRSLVKGGKLASQAADGQSGGKEEVQKVGVTAVNKLLVAVEDIIKKTVKETLKKAKEKIDEARAPKTVGQK